MSEVGVGSLNGLGVKKKKRGKCVNHKCNLVRFVMGDDIKLNEVFILIT